MVDENDARIDVDGTELGAMELRRPSFGDLPQAESEILTLCFTAASMSEKAKRRGVFARGPLP
jgi:hypothetical protein